MNNEAISIQLLKRKPIVLQHYSKKQINNGGPATGALLLINSYMKKHYEFPEMNEYFESDIFKIKTFKYFYQTIKSVNPDIIHIRGIHIEGFLGVLAAKLQKKKVVMSVHGVYIDVLKKNTLKRFLFNHFFEAYALKKADLVYCVCKYATQRSFIQKHSRNLYGYIYNAAPDYDEFLKSNSKKDLRSSFNLNNNDIVISIVSRVTVDKGFEVLSSAIPSIIERNHKIKFLVAGDGPYLTKFKNSISLFINNGYVKCIGKTSNVKDVLFASDIFVFPTLHENLSNSLLEACSIGLPIIATNVGGNPEIITSNKNGLLIEPNNPDELVNAVLRLSSDSNLQISFSESTKEHIEKNFSQKRIFNQLENMYNYLLNQQ